MIKSINQKEGLKYLNKLGKEFVVIQNPNFVHPKFEIVPLAPKLKLPAKNISAVLMDMDGTTTTTEELCIHSLEFMIRKITNRLSKKDWAGFDYSRDYKNIIGNSTTKHVEYLINSFEKFIIINELKKSFLFSAIWILIFVNDASRKNEVENNLISFRCSELLKDGILIRMQKSKSFPGKDFKFLVNKYSAIISIKNKLEIVRASIDIYYYRYHKILLEISQGNSKNISKEIFNDSEKKLIAPLPNVAFLLALIKGLLKDEASKLADTIIEQYVKNNSNSKLVINKTSFSNKLKILSSRFQSKPVKVALVTSSIFYEANIVLTEIFRLLNEEINSWKISDKTKLIIQNKFLSYKTYYDSVVTANDASEMRLKPHRDLYSTALNNLSIPIKDFNKVIGFEDSESGITSIRAAGIGRCIAVPFSFTMSHNFSLASFKALNGIIDVITKVF